MDKIRKTLALVLAAALLTVSLTACSKTTTATVSEESSTKWAELTSDQLIIEGISDPTVKFDSAMVNGNLYAVFNGIWKRNTPYFAAPTGTLTITACGSAEGTQKFKLALWQKVDGGVQYVPDTTYYVTTDGQDYKFTLTGLDVSAVYRITISYDSSKYYLTGLLKVEGVG